MEPFVFRHHTKSAFIDYNRSMAALPKDALAVPQAFTELHPGLFFIECLSWHTLIVTHESNPDTPWDNASAGPLNHSIVRDFFRPARNRRVRKPDIDVSANG